MAKGNRPRDNRMNLKRRDLVRAAAATGLLAAGGAAIHVSSVSAQVSTRARIVIAGAGGAGMTAANRLVHRLGGASITVIERRNEHWYQPGFTLVAAGLKPANYTVLRNADFLPSGITWLKEQVAEFDLDANRVVTDAGTTVAYDFLIVATGLHLDYDAIEGFEIDRIGRDGIGSVYAGPEAAAATWAEAQRFLETGGVGLFSRPATEMKCAGAPLKYAFLTDDHLRRTGNREKAELIYAAQSGSLFSVPIVAEKIRMLFHDRSINAVYDHVMTGIDHGRKVARFQTPNGTAEIGFDFTNVIPPMRAPAAVRNSPLPWQTGPFAADGWMEVEKTSMRHRRYPNVFGVGDVAGVPKGKTAASVKWQVPVAVDHLIADIQDQTSDMVYNGYTSCPLITRIGRAMLVEFDYDNNLTPSFPGVVAPLEELWVTWVMKETALKATYTAMLRGAA